MALVSVVANCKSFLPHAFSVCYFDAKVTNLCFRYVESCLCRPSSEQDSENQWKFVTQQLLTLMGVVDLSDEVGR